MSLPTSLPIEHWKCQYCEHLFPLEQSYTGYFCSEECYNNQMNLCFECKRPYYFNVKICVQENNSTGLDCPKCHKKCHKKN